MWLARDEEGALWLFNEKPELILIEFRGENFGHGWSGDCIGKLKGDMFPNVTYEGGPHEVFLLDEDDEDTICVRFELPKNKTLLDDTVKRIMAQKVKDVFLEEYEKRAAGKAI